MFKNAADKIYLTTYGQGSSQAQLFVRAEALWVETAAGERPLAPSELNDADTVMRLLCTPEARTALTGNAYGVLAETNDGSYSVSIQMRGLGGGGVCSADQGPERARKQKIAKVKRVLTARAYKGKEEYEEVFVSAVGNWQSTWTNHPVIQERQRTISIALSPLVDLLRDEDPVIQNEAIQILNDFVSLCDRTDCTLIGRDDSLRSELLDKLCGLNSALTRSASHILATLNASESLIERLIAKPGAIKRLAELYRDEDPEVKQCVSRLLVTYDLFKHLRIGRMNHMPLSETEDRLVELLKDLDPIVRGMATYLLDSMRHPCIHTEIEQANRRWEWERKHPRRRQHGHAAIPGVNKSSSDSLPGFTGGRKEFSIIYARQSSLDAAIAAEVKNNAATGVEEHKSTEEALIAVDEVTVETWHTLGLKPIQSSIQSTKAITVLTAVIEGTPVPSQLGTPAAIELADAYLFRSRAFSWLASQAANPETSEEQWHHTLADAQQAVALYGDEWSECKVEAVLTIGKAHYHLHEYTECVDVLKSLTHPSTLDACSYARFVSGARKMLASPGQLDSNCYAQLINEAHGWSAQADYQRQDYASVLYHYAARGWVQADSAVAGADECAAAVYEQQQQPAHEALNALPLSPELCTLYFQRAQACYQAQPSRYQAALGYLSLALTGLPTAEVYHLRCTIYLLQQRYDLAQQDAERALTADPSHALTYHHLGWMLQQQGGDRMQIMGYYHQFLERAGERFAAGRASALYGQWWCAPATTLIEAEEGVGDGAIAAYQAARQTALTTAQNLMHTAQSSEPFWVKQQQTIEAALKINDDQVALALECHRRGEYLAAYRLLAVCIDKSPGRKDLQLHQIEALYALANSKKDFPEEQQDDLKLAKHDIDAFLQRCKREGAPPAQKAQAQSLLERIEQSLVGTENPYLYPESDDRIGESIEIIGADIDTHSMDGESKATVEGRFAVTAKLSAEMLAAIESGCLEDLKRVLANDHQQLNASDEARNTPLHLLVAKGKLKSVHYLLEQGADATRANHEFKRAINVATDPAIKRLLLEQRKRHDAKVVVAYLETCLKNYYDASVDERPQVLRRQVARYVSRLTGVDVLALLSQGESEMRKRYVAHLEEIVGTNPEVSPQGRLSVEGWWAREFLPLRIYATVEVLVNMMRDRDSISRSYSPDNWPPGTMPVVTGQRLEPNDLFALNIAASRVIETYQRYLLTELETLYSHQEQEVVGIPQRALNTDEQELLKALTDGILNRLSRLTQGDSACYYVGYKGHAIHLNIIKQADGYAITIHNVGEGYLRYHTVDVASGEVYAFPLGILSTAELQCAMTESNHPFRQYLFKILTAWCEQKAAADALPILYVSDPDTLKLSALPIDPQTKCRPQKGGHCVLRSHESVRWQVLGSKATWLTKKEKILVADEDRAAPQNLAKVAGDCSTVDSHFHRQTSSKVFQSEAEKLAEMQQRVAKRAVTQLCNLLNQWLQHNHLSAAQCEFVNERYLARMPISQDSVFSVLETMRQFVNELNGADAIIVASMPTSATGESFMDFRCDPEHLDELARRMARFPVATALPSIVESMPTPPPEIAKWVEGFGQPAAVTPPVTVSPCLDQLSRSREQAAAVQPRKIEAVRPMRASPYLVERSRNPQANSVRFANPVAGV